MRGLLYATLGVICGSAGFVSLPYLFTAMHDLSDELSGQLAPDIAKWEPFAAVGLTGLLSFGAFFMTFRLFRYALLASVKS